MKNILVVAITAMSLAAVAQTSAPTTTAAAPTATAAPTAPVKKAKKAVKPSAQVVPAVETAPAAAPATAMAPEGEKTVTPNDAAGTSTTSAAAAAPVKAWKGSVSVTPSSLQSDVAAVQVLTKAGLSYKVAEKLTVKIAQTFETLAATENTNAEHREWMERSNFRSAYTDVSLSTTGKGILGSNDLPLSFNYKKMSGDALLVQKTTFASIDTTLDLNATVPYTLSPKFDLGIDTQARYYINDIAAKSSFRFIVSPTLSYNINDKWSVYQGAGMILSLKDNADMRRNYERLSISTGVGYAASKSLSFDVNVSQDKALYINPVQPLEVTSFTPYKTTDASSRSRTFDSVGYEASVAYNF